MNSRILHQKERSANGDVVDVLDPGKLKTVLVAALARVSSYRGQRLAAFVVRLVWPGFRVA